MDSDVNFPNECREEDGEEEREEREGDKKGEDVKGPVSSFHFLLWKDCHNLFVSFLSLDPAGREWRVILEAKAETQEVTTLSFYKWRTSIFGGHVC